jgi:hypothetical protein
MHLAAERDRRTGCWMGIVGMLVCFISLKLIDFRERKIL